MNEKDMWDLRGSNSAFALQEFFPEILELLRATQLLPSLAVCSGCQQELGKRKYKPKRCCPLEVA